MTTVSEFPTTLPDHTQLPESDGTFVNNYQELARAYRVKALVKR
jgi:hypothetical protein